MKTITLLYYNRYIFSIKLDREAAGAIRAVHRCGASRRQVGRRYRERLFIQCNNLDSLVPKCLDVMQ